MEYYIGGQFSRAENAMVHAHDLGLLRGYGIFDFFPIQNFSPVFFEDYLARFENSARMMDLEIPLSLESLREKILELIHRNRLPDAYIRLLLTGGMSENGFTPAEPLLAIMEYDYHEFRKDMPKDGIKLLTDQFVRVIPEAKTTSYFHVIRMRKKLLAARAADVLYHDGSCVTESSRSNFFIFTGQGTLVTAKNNVLPGVTRKQILKVAENHFEVQVRDLTLQEVLHAKEAFISSTLKGVLPVTQIDQTIIGDGQMGTQCKKLSKLFEAHREAAAKVSIG